MHRDTHMERQIFGSEPNMEIYRWPQSCSHAYASSISLKNINAKYIEIRESIGESRDTY